MEIALCIMIINYTVVTTVPSRQQIDLQKSHAATIHPVGLGWLGTIMFFGAIIFGKQIQTDILGAR